MRTSRQAQHVEQRAEHLTSRQHAEVHVVHLTSRKKNKEDGG